MHVRPHEHPAGLQYLGAFQGSRMAPGHADEHKEVENGGECSGLRKALGSIIKCIGLSSPLVPWNLPAPEWEPPSLTVR